MTKSSSQLAYEDAMQNLTPRERIERCVVMAHWARQVIARQLILQNGPMSPELLKYEMTKRIYGSNSKVAIWMNRMINDVSR